MKELPIAWLQEDEIENIRQYDLGFAAVRGVILNTSTLKIPNMFGDYVYIGFTYDLSDILFVFYRLEDAIRRVIFARRVSQEEQNTLFAFITREV